ncbi:hypothetical protein B0I72DRAFT_136449 [Yarrowia lipolytica]|jgi:oligosaccharyltransferase complex subunit gamma|nr:hypothetical protein BKA91DRAFT_137377 [Yarrowia lipolytica]KAE8172400.1 hypothetical protein BKA90DRAFT_137461 [Yarrowia lipolytica]QNP97781.1 Dolichyl-diphosphooligosaccharide--protein glycosyltransferase subunit 3 [Yarrowia lipolytica]RDW28806.1 hypothetical protein B0I71DRAFT_126718 [Yarrowia lipolytica]RDW33371.1 hypothetical protein B0I72DRAFT_136449 [Yarrowia lipolytica]
MHVLAPIVALFLLATTAFAQVFDAEFIRENLPSLSRSKGVIRLNDQNFQKLVGGPRDYHFVVLLTAEAAQFGCHLCKEFGPSFDLLAASYLTDHPDSDNVFFGIADFSESQATYRGLDLTAAPNFWIFPPTEKNIPIGGEHYKFSFPQVDNLEVPAGNFIREVTGKDFKIHYPFRWDKLFSAILTIAGVGVGLVVFKKQLKVFFAKRNVWAAATLVLILMFVAGHMYNIIRKTQYIVADGNNNPVYFVGGFSQQIGVETQIIALTYALLAFCVISLALRAPSLNTGSKQVGVTLALCIVILVAYSFLLAKFHIKNGGYPYHLLNIF